MAVVDQAVAAMFCPSCGAQIANGVRFCSSCGAQAPTTLPGQVSMGGAPTKGQPPPYGTPIGKNGMPQPVTLMPTQALALPAQLNRCYLGLGWTSHPGRPELDLDASAALFSNGQCVDVVSFQKLRDQPSGKATVVHTGDVLTGGGSMKSSPSPNRDLERIYFDLVGLSPQITSIGLLINLYTDGASFAELQNATCRIVNADTEQEFGRFQLTNLKGNGLIFGQLNRNPKPGSKEWRFVAVGAARPGRTAQDLVASLNQQAQQNMNNPKLQPKPGQTADPVAVKPTASRTSPGMVAATAAGVAAGGAIFTCVALETGMLGGEGGMISGAMADLGDISMPDMPDMDLDLAPVGDAMASLGDMGGDALNSAGEVVGDLGSSLSEGFADMGGMEGIASSMGEFGGNAAEWAGDAAGNIGDMAGNAFEAAPGMMGGAAEWAGDAAGNIGDFAGNAGEWAGDAAGNIGDFAGTAGEWIGGAVGAAGDAMPDADQAADLCSSLCEMLGGLAGGGDE